MTTTAVPAIEKVVAFLTLTWLEAQVTCNVKVLRHRGYALVFNLSSKSFNLLN